VVLTAVLQKVLAVIKGGPQKMQEIAMQQMMQQMMKQMVKQMGGAQGGWVGGWVLRLLLGVLRLGGWVACGWAADGGRPGWVTGASTAVAQS
jgi:hypothetical protein